MQNEGVLSDAGQILKTGYTTGSCATAAAKAALLNTSKPQIAITLPSQETLTIPILSLTDHGAKGVTAVVVKDAGDDYDVTHGIEIYVNVQLTEHAGVVDIRGGEGVGIVTKGGLQTPVGSWAINPTPLKMIRENLAPYLPEGKGVIVEITIPRGREIAKKTFNARLGIEGGISIIGTTGIVRPMSEEAFKDAIYIELKQKYTMGIRTVYLVPGMHGEKFAIKHFGISEKEIVQMSNYVGFSLNAAEKIGFTELILVGHIGKLIKLAGGIFNTHSKVADGKAHILAAHLALMSAPVHLIRTIYHLNTTDEVSDHLINTHYVHVFKHIAEEAKRKCIEHMSGLEHLEIIFYDMKGRLLADTSPDSEVYR